MGHIFILCGPPGSGKTTLLKMIPEKGIPLKQLQRMTTREKRPEEGDAGKSNREYEFLTQGEFAGRLAQGNVANFIEWNQQFYATDTVRLQKAFDSHEDYILHEDMPSAVHLKRRYPSQVTVLLLFTDDLDELLRIDFAEAPRTGKDAIVEWRRRLAIKYSRAVAQRNGSVSESEQQEYVQKKMQRALPDLAFMVGRIRDERDGIRVIANRRDDQEGALQQFQRVVEDVKQNYPGAQKFAFVLMPFGDVGKGGQYEEGANFDKLYNFVIKPAVEGEGLKCLRGDEISKRPEILQDVVDHMEKAEFVIVDISGGNPNVFLELGMCLKLGKEIIIISRDQVHQVPFNAASLRRIDYEDNSAGWKRLHNEIQGRMRSLGKRNLPSA